MVSVVTFRLEVIKSDLLFFITIKKLSKMLSSPAYPVNFAIRKCLLIDIDAQNAICIYNLNFRVINC